MSLMDTDNTRLIAGLTLVCLILLFTIVGAYWTPYDPLQIDLSNRFALPSSSHLLGTDRYGRDEFSRLFRGSSNSVLVGFISVGIGASLGMLLGVVAAMGNSLTDEVLSRVMDAIYALPAILLALLITSVFGPGIRNSMIAIGIFNVPIFGRLSRASVLTIKEKEYVIAARSVGVSKTRLIWRYLIPNSASVLLIQASNSFARALLAEAGLSYLGLGTQAPHPSWGRMLRSAQTFVDRNPLLVIFPGLAILITVLGFNLLAEGLRDYLDPYTPNPNQ